MTLAGVLDDYHFAKLVIVPQAPAYALLLFCLRNPTCCPIRAAGDVGDPFGTLARGAHRNSDYAAALSVSLLFKTFPAPPSIARRARADRGEPGRRGCSRSNRSSVQGWYIYLVSGQCQDPALSALLHLIRKDPPACASRAFPFLAAASPSVGAKPRP